MKSMQNIAGGENLGFAGGSWDVDPDVRVPLKAAQPQKEFTMEETQSLAQAAAEALDREAREGLEMGGMLRG